MSEGKQADSFEKILVEVIRKCISDLLGNRVAQAMDFYLDPSLAASSPELYAHRLELLTGASPSNVILRRIEASLCSRLGVAQKDWGSFAECINQLKTGQEQIGQSVS